MEKALRKIQHPLVTREPQTLAIQRASECFLLSKGFSSAAGRPRNSESIQVFPGSVNTPHVDSQGLECDFLSG